MKNGSRITGPLMARTTVGRCDLIVDPQGIAEQSVTPLDLLDGALSASVAESIADAALRTGINIKGLHVEVSHTWNSSTRKIGTIAFKIICPRPVPLTLRPLLEEAARRAPARSCLGKTVSVKMDFLWEK